MLPAILCARALVDKAVPDGTIVVIGDRTAERSARSLGLDPSTRLTLSSAGSRQNARLLRERIASGAHIICWNDELAALIASDGRSSELISTLPSAAPSAPRARTMIRVLDQVDRDAWSDQSRDAILDRDLPSLVDHFRPRSDRDELREQMGICDDTILVAVLSDSPAQTDAREFSFLLGLLAAAGFRVAGLLPESARHHGIARRHHRALHCPFRLFFTHDPILSHLPAIDLMLQVDRSHSASTHLLSRLCDNADVPVMQIEHAGRRGLSSDPSDPARMLEQFDEIVRAQQRTKAAH